MKTFILFAGVNVGVRMNRVDAGGEGCKNTLKYT